MTPTVAEVADTAAVSRATAYRYFPTQEFLLFEAALDNTGVLVKQIFEEALTSDNAETRLDALIIALQSATAAQENAFRTLLRLSLEQRPSEEPGEGAKPFLVRGGRRIGWLEEALAPVRERLGPEVFRRLVAALSLCMGIEAQVVLRDICVLDNEEAAQVSRWAGRSLLRAALAEAKEQQGAG